MRAAVVEQFGKPLVLREWDVPVPGPEQILVKNEACGVCHTGADMSEAPAFAAEGKVTADIELRPLSAMNEVFQRLERGDVPARVILELKGS